MCEKYRKNSGEIQGNVVKTQNVNCLHVLYATYVEIMLRQNYDSSKISTLGVRPCISDCQ